ncbi:MAG: FAD-dependent oxidoreductase [Christensenellales bacterium]|jgi:2-enoate reductase
MKYEHLFQPIMIGKTYIKNRIVLAPINNSSQMRNDTGSVTETMVDYFSEIAKGGTGLIVTGVFKCENEIERCYNEKQKIYSWAFFNHHSLREMSELVSRVHAYGAKIFIQLSAGPGRVTPGHIIDSGVTPVSASPNLCYYRRDVTCRELATEEVEKIVAAFGETAVLCKQVGLDGIEIHGHEGYLIDQFTTALWNRRTDKYGGDLEARCTFPIEILQAIKKACGQDYTVTYRTGAKHFIGAPFKSALRPGMREMGREPEETIEMCKYLEKAGYDGFSLDTGCYEGAYWAHPPYYQPHGCAVDITAQVKRALKTPVMVAGRLGIPELANQIIAENKTDMVALGRDLLADPHWPNKVQKGQVEDIRPCLACHEGCMVRAFAGMRLSCSVNPSCSKEGISRITPTLDKKKIIVAGGGIAGMEFARVATLRGHKVTLYEKSNKLAGHLNEAAVPSFKSDIKRLIKWYLLQLNKAQVDIRMNTLVDVALIEKEDPDVVVVATGSTYQYPNITGIEKNKVTTCCELLNGEVQAGHQVTVIGGGLEGIETALWLAQSGHEVTLIEMEKSINTRGMMSSQREMITDLLCDSKVKIMCDCKLNAITSKGILVVNPNKDMVELICDTVVMATGVVSNFELYDALITLRPMVYNIGDSKKPRKIHDAIFEGWYLGMNI